MERPGAPFLARTASRSLRRVLRFTSPANPAVVKASTSAGTVSRGLIEPILSSSLGLGFRGVNHCRDSGTLGRADGIRIDFRSRRIEEATHSVLPALPICLCRPVLFQGFGVVCYRGVAGDAEDA